MKKLSGAQKKKRLLLASAAGAVALAVLIGSLWLRNYRFEHRYDFPELPFSDISETQVAAKTEQLNGKAFVRGPVAADLPAADAGAFQPGVMPPGTFPLNPGSTFFLKTLFQVTAGSALNLSTEGTWVQSLEGDGEFILLDARTNKKRNVHLVTWHVKKGTFRAKPSEAFTDLRLLELRTNSAVIRVWDGELGMKVGDDGHGQLWLMTGRGAIFWRDGRQKDLGLRGLENF